MNKYHQSQLSTFLLCGQQYYYRYVKGIKAPPGIAAHVGTGVHRGIEANMKVKLEHGHDKRIALEAVQEIAATAVKARIDRQGVMLSKEERERSENVIIGEAVDRAVALATIHWKVLAPFIRPRRVEWPWVVSLPQRPYKLAGTIDLQDQNGCLRDTKTTSRSPEKDRAHKSDQLTIYAMVLNAFDGEIPSIQQDYLVATKTWSKKWPAIKDADRKALKKASKKKGSPIKVVTQETRRDSEDFRGALNRVDAMHKAVKKGVFPPAPSDHWVCSEKWCGYADRCPYFRGRKTMSYE